MIKEPAKYAAPTAGAALSDTPITDYLLGRQWSAYGNKACPDCGGMHPTAGAAAAGGPFFFGHRRSCPLARALAAIGEMVSWAPEG